MKELAITISLETGWVIRKDDPKDRVIIFRKRDQVSGNKYQIDYYYTTGTIKTSLDHPKEGKTQMFRRNVDGGLLRRIFENPRVHTDKGYQTRNSARKRGIAL
jgi:hypothetical protein